MFFPRVFSHLNRTAVIGQNKFLSRVTAIVVIGPRQTWKPAKPTQLFIPLLAASFSASIAQLLFVVNKISQWMLSNLLCLNPFKTEFIIIGLSAQIEKFPDPSTQLSDNSYSTTFISNVLGVIFKPHLSFSNHISNLSRSCFMDIRDLRRIRPMLDFKTASIIATFIVHSKLDYCNSLFLSLGNSLFLSPNTPSPAHSKFTCAGRHQNAQASSHYSCS